MEQQINEIKVKQNVAVVIEFASDISTDEVMEVMKSFQTENFHIIKDMHIEVYNSEE